MFSFLWPGGRRTLAALRPWPQKIIFTAPYTPGCGYHPNLFTIKKKVGQYDYIYPARAPGSVHGGPGSINIDSAFTGPPTTGKDPRTKAHRPFTGPRLNLRARGGAFSMPGGVYRLEFPADRKAPRGQCNFDATPLEWTDRIASSPLIGH
jgi:hypothetical protein